MGPGAKLVSQGLEEVRSEVPVFQHIEQAKVRQAGDQNHSPAIGFVSRGDRLFLLFGGGPAQVIEPPQEKPRPIDDDSGVEDIEDGLAPAHYGRKPCWPPAGPIHWTRWGSR
ncbi:MAG: hypothetical protein ACLR1T_01765 [Evtepia gabavorous]